MPCLYTAMAAQTNGSSRFLADLPVATTGGEGGRGGIHHSGLGFRPHTPGCHSSPGSEDVGNPRDCRWRRLSCGRSLRGAGWRCIRAPGSIRAPAGESTLSESEHGRATKKYVIRTWVGRHQSRFNRDAHPTCSQANLLSGQFAPRPVENMSHPACSLHW